MASIRAGLLRKLGDDFGLRVVQVPEVEKTPSGKHRWLATKPEPVIVINGASAAQQDAVSFHDAKSADWEALYLRPSFQLRRHVIMNLLRPHLKRGEHWLDAGCGSGYFARELAREDMQVTGVDAAAGMIEESIARAAQEQTPERMGFECVPSIEHLPFAKASFDGVLCSSVIEYVPDYAQALRELSRVLRRGGALLVTVPNKAAISRWMERAAHEFTSKVLDDPWPRYLQHSRWQFDETSLRVVLAAHGLHLQTVDYFGPALPAWINRHRRGGMMLAALAVKQ